MSTLSVRLPASLHHQIKVLAEQEGISMNHLITVAVAEKVATLRTVAYLEDRARRGSRALFEAVLAKVPDVEPEEYDRF